MCAGAIHSVNCFPWFGALLVCHISNLVLLGDFLYCSRWPVLNSMSSVLAIENNRENQPILNQIYEILTELQNQGKQLTLCKVPEHIGIKGCKEMDKAAKQAIPGMTTAKLSYTYYYLTCKRARNSKLQRQWENSTRRMKSAYNCCRQYEVKLRMIRIGYSRLTHWHLMSRNEQLPTCRNAACRNQILTIKHCLQDCPQWRDSSKK